MAGGGGADPAKGAGAWEASGGGQAGASERGHPLESHGARSTPSGVGCDNTRCVVSGEARLSLGVQGSS